MDIDPVKKSLYTGELLQYAFGRTLERQDLMPYERASALRGIVTNLSTIARSVQGDEGACLKVSAIFDACLNDPALKTDSYASVEQALQNARSECFPQPRSA